MLALLGLLNCWGGWPDGVGAAGVLFAVVLTWYNGDYSGISGNIEVGRLFESNISENSCYRWRWWGGVKNFASWLKIVESEEWRLHYGDGSTVGAYISRSCQYSTNMREHRHFVILIIIIIIIIIIPLAGPANNSLIWDCINSPYLPTIIGCQKLDIILTMYQRQLPHILTVL